MLEPRAVGRPLVEFLQTVSAEGRVPDQLQFREAFPNGVEKRRPVAVSEGLVRAVLARGERQPVAGSLDSPVLVAGSDRVLPERTGLSG